MKTKTRIAEAALELFNEQGTAAVSTNHIAEAAGISPGNLYYHFRSKDEIIRALFDLLSASWDAAFALGDGLPALADLERMVRANFEVMWRFRFFYRELIVLLRRDPALREDFAAIRRRGLADFAQLVAAFGAAGVMEPLAPGETAELAALCWLVSEFWLPSLELGGETVDETSIERGVALLMRVLRPHLRC